MSNITSGNTIISVGDKNKDVYIYVGEDNNEYCINQNGHKLYKTYFDDISHIKDLYKSDGLLINDIFAEIDFCNNKKESEIISFESLKDELISRQSKIHITGEQLSGKTTIVNKLFIDLFECGYQPLILSLKNNFNESNLDREIRKSFEKSYSSEVDCGKLVLIIDDFHHLVRKKQILEKIEGKSPSIVIVSDKYCIEALEIELIDFLSLNIEPLSDLQRMLLIQKWIDCEKAINILNERFKKEEDYISNTNTILGKILDKQIVPSYPFYILQMLNIRDTYDTPINQEITSHGHFFEKIIDSRLGIKKNHEKDFYVNFLSSFAYYLFKENTNNISKHKYNDFVNQYSQEYDMMLSPQKLQEGDLFKNILTQDERGISFTASYTYFYFIGKYFSDHISEENIKKEIDNIIEKIYLDSYAGIIIFISFHSKNEYITDKLCSLINKTFYDSTVICELITNLSSHLEDISTQIVEYIVEDDRDPIENRKKEISNNSQRTANKAECDNEKENELSDFNRQYKICIRASDVVGTILKNRSYSLKKPKKKEILEDSVEMNFRLLGYIFNIFNDEKMFNDFTEIVIKSLPNKTTHNKEVIIEKIKLIVREIFQGIVAGTINRIRASLMSNSNDTGYIDFFKECESPILKILVNISNTWNMKNINFKEIATIFDQKTPIIASNIMRILLAHYYSLHEVKSSDKQKLEQIAKIKFLPKNKSIYPKKS